MITKRLISLFLCIVMMLGAFPLAALAEDTNTEATEEQTGEMSLSDGAEAELESDGGLGSLVSNTLSEQEESEDESEIDIRNKILKVTVEENAATVEFNNAVDCRIVVAIYDENTQHMKGSGIGEFKKNTQRAEITLEIDPMPEYFVVKAYLLDLENTPLHTSYESIEYTKAHRDFLDSTIDDYADKNVINFDDDRKNNFAVFKDETVIMDCTDLKNTVVSSNEQTGTYVFSNTDSSMQGLKENDSFYCTTEDGDTICGKVKEVTVSEGTVTVVTDPDAGLDDLFDVVKIENTACGEGAEVDVSDLDSGVDYSGMTVGSSGLSNINGLELKWSVSTEKDSDASISTGFNMKAEISIVLDPFFSINKYSDYCVIEAKLTEQTTVDVAFYEKVSGKVNLGKINIPILGGIYMNTDLNFVFETTGAVSARTQECTTAGFRFDSRKGIPENISVPTVSNTQLNFEGEMFVGVEARPEIEALGCITLSYPLKAGIEFKAISTETGVTDSLHHTCRVCYDGEANCVFSISVGYSVKIFWGLKWESEVDLCRIELKLFDYYISDGVLNLGDCPNHYYKVTFCVSDKDGRSISGVSITNNTPMSGSVPANAVTDVYGQAQLFCRIGENNVSLSCGGYEPKDRSFEVEGVDSVSVTLEALGENDIDYGPIYRTGKCGDNLTYTWYYCGIVEITGTGAMYDFGSPKDHTYSPFEANIYNGKEPIERVIISYGATHIGRYAFLQCSLESIDIPSSVKSIGERAFRLCSELKEVNISHGVEEIGGYAFSECTGLEAVLLPDSVTSIGVRSFENCFNLKSINIPSGVKRISECTFYDCISLEEVAFNEGLEIIEMFGFASCRSLDNLDLPDSLKVIGLGGFAFCDALSSVTFGNQTVSLQRGGYGSYPQDYYSVFHECDNLKNISIPWGWTAINDYAFYDLTSLETISISSSVETIGDYAFYNCTGLEKITLREGLTSIDSYAFYNCTSLESVALPDSMTSIDSNAFGNCTSLSELSFGNQSVELYYPFKNCTQLKHITIPVGWTYISDGAFSGLTSLESITLPYSLTSIGDRAFNGCTSLETVSFPDSLTRMGYSAFNGCTSLSTVSFGNKSIYFDDDNRSSPFEGCTQLKHITIPSGWTFIDEYAFKNVKSLESISLPYTLTSIGDYAFQSCSSLTRISLPSSVKSVGDYAFSYCRNLTSVNLSENMTYIPEESFLECSSLEVITIPTGVVSIRDRAFQGCSSLSKIVFPKGLGYIGEYAFRNCSAIKTIYYKGTQEEWANVTKKSQGTSGFYSANVYCTGVASTAQASVSTAVSAQITEYESPVEDISYVTEPVAAVSVVPETELTVSSAQIETYDSETADSTDTAEETAIVEMKKTKTGLIPGGYYVLAVISGYSKNFELASDTLLYITDTVADENGTAEFTYYIPDVPYALFVFGGCGHTLSDWISFAPTTCEDSVRVRICTKCKDIVEDEFVPATGHLPGEWSISVPSAGGEQGVRVQYCTYCNKEFVGQFVADGDVDGDGNMTNSDLSLILRYFSGYGMGESFSNTDIDLNADGLVNNRDAVALIQILAGWSVDRSVTLNLENNVDVRGIEYTLDRLTMTATVKGPAAETLHFTDVVIPCRVLSDGRIYRVVGIEKNAFKGHAEITSITPGANLESIGTAAFDGCDSLTGVYLTDLGAWFDIEFANYKANPLSIAKNIYLNGELITELTVPESVTELKAFALFGSSVSVLTLHGGVKSIGEHALYGLGVSELTLPEGVQSIGENAFRNCKALETVIIPKSLKSVGNEAFYGCSALSKVQIASLYAWCKIDFAHYTANPTYYAKCLYVGERELTALNISANVGAIKNYTFIGCERVTKITVPEGITSIGDYAFYGCKELKEVSIPSTVNIIGKVAFRNCTELSKVTIAYGVESIGDGAFYGCTALDDVYYTGTKYQWSSVSIADNNDPLKSSAIHYES